MGIARHLHFPVEAVPQALLPFKTRSTWAYPIHYRPALVSSILSMPFALGLPCGRPAQEQPGRDQFSTAFPCSAITTGRLGAHGFHHSPLNR